MIIDTARRLHISPSLLGLLVRRHVSPAGTMTEMSERAVLADLGTVVAPAPLPEPLVPGEVRHMLPAPWDLPVSLAFEPDPRQPWALRARYPWGFKRHAEEFVRRAGGRCALCGRGKGDPYWAAIRSEDGQVLGRVQRESRGPQAAHLSNDPARVGDGDLVPCCPQCHGSSEYVHRYGCVALTLAGTPEGSRLGTYRRDRALGLIRRAAALHAEHPWAAMQVGGADFLTAYVLDVDGEVSAELLGRYVPELLAVSATDTARVLAATRARLRLRGLLGADGRLVRPLMQPDTAIAEAFPVVQSPHKRSA